MKERIGMSVQTLEKSGAVTGKDVLQGVGMQSEVESPVSALIVQPEEVAPAGLRGVYESMLARF